jgi:DNA-directed RNA polymerase subunit alpha
MHEYSIILPTKPRAVKDEPTRGIFEIDNLYPGYGHTLGNSLRRIILSSLPGAAITSIKIDGADHEFSTLNGVREDAITIILHLKQLRFKLHGDGSEEITLSVKGNKKVTAADIKTSSQVELLNPELYIAEITDKSGSLDITMRIERGLGFVTKEEHQRAKVEIGTIAVDAIFTPIRRVSYEVENMRVGDNTNHNRLRINIETDGSITPREALNRSIRIMIEQLDAMLDHEIRNISKDEDEESVVEISAEESKPKTTSGDGEFTDILKTRIDTLGFSTRILTALQNANIRTVGGIARKKKDDLLDIDGMGEKGIQEIKNILSNFGITLKE